MRSVFIFLSATFLFSRSLGTAETKTDPKQFWHQWRGPLASGVAPLANPPLHWSETENVKWKSKIPGFGTSTPIIWGEKVFILTAIPTGKKNESKSIENQSGPRHASVETPQEAFQFVVLCLDRQNGKTLWQKTAREEVPHEGHHKDHGYASASPITDGKDLLAYFGSHGLYCFDLDGKLKWEKDFGDMQTRNSFGEGSSVALHGNTVVVLWDHEGDDFIAALDKSTGKELWRQKRDEPTGWSTPLITEHEGKAQVIVNATGKVRGYDLASGKPLWEAGGQTANAIPTPVADDKTVYVTSGFRGNALQAIQLGRTGDLTGTDAIRWSHNKNTPYVPSPLLVDGYLYFIGNNSGILSCFDAKTGKAHYDGERLEGIFGIYASPVSAGDRVYVLGRDGKCLVLKKGPKLEVLATNKIDGLTDSSLALVGKEMFLRTHENLYCISEK